MSLESRHADPANALILAAFFRWLGS